MAGRADDDDDDDDDDELEDEEDDELPWVGSAKDLMKEVAGIKREMAKREEDRRAALYKEAMAAKAVGFRCSRGVTFVIRPLTLSPQRSAGGMEHLTRDEIAKMLLPKALDFLAADESRSSHTLGAWDNYFMKKCVASRPADVLRVRDSPHLPSPPSPSTCLNPPSTRLHPPQEI